LSQARAALCHDLQKDVTWDLDVRIKVGAALLALLVENSHLPTGLPGLKSKTWMPTGNSSSSSSQALAAAAAGSSSTDVPAFEYVYMKMALKQQAFVRASQTLVQVLLADRSVWSYNWS
jgi:hypothetical protein